MREIACISNRFKIEALTLLRTHMTAYAGTIRYGTGTVPVRRCGILCRTINIFRPFSCVRPPSPGPRCSVCRQLAHSPLFCLLFFFFYLAISYLIFFFCFCFQLVSDTNQGFPTRARAWLGQPCHGS